MATQHLIERWIHSALTFAVVVLLYGAALLFLQTAIPEITSITEPVDSLVIGSAFALTIYGIVTQIYLGFFDEKAGRRILRKEHRVWNRAADLVDRVLFGEIGWREPWIRARLEELERLENDPELMPLVKWRFRIVVTIGVLALSIPLALRFVV